MWFVVLVTGFSLYEISIQYASIFGVVISFTYAWSFGSILLKFLAIRNEGEPRALPFTKILVEQRTIAYLLYFAGIIAATVFGELATNITLGTFWSMVMNSQDSINKWKILLSLAAAFFVFVDFLYEQNT